MQAKRRRKRVRTATSPALAIAPLPPSAALPLPRRRLFIVDDHPMVRERLGELIGQEPDLSVCGEAEDAVTAAKLIGQLQPDLAIVDITLKDTYGIELVKTLKEHQPHVPVLVLSMHDESVYGERAIRAGARGYLNKQEASKKVVPAIRTILAGQVFVSEKLTSTILQKLAGGQRPDGAAPTDVLSDRELEVFQLMGGGASVRRISETLFISIKTAEAHREHIKRKMNFGTSHELLRHAIVCNMNER